MSALQFLNKKSWHTATLKNNERVWKAEKRAEEEAKRMAELKKQLEQERELEALHRLEVEAGRTDAAPRTEKLEWMYEFSGPAKGGAQMTVRDDADGQDGVGASKVNEKEREEYLLGKKEAKIGDGAVKPLNATPRVLIDVEAKLREDPLFAIRMEERKVVQEIRSNPVKMAQLRAEREARRKDKLKRKEERAAIRKVRRQRREESAQRQVIKNGENGSAWQ